VRVTSKLLKIIVPIVVLGVAVGAFLFWSPAEPAAEADGRTWTCSMHPQVRLPQPGRCPICGMNLIPIERLTSEQSRLDAAAGVETEAVKYRELYREIRTVGKLDYNERRVAEITARIDGRVDRVFADFTGIRVAEGDHLVEIYSPALYTAQSELLQALGDSESETRDSRLAKSSLESARTKLRLLGILPEQLAEIERTREVSTHLTIFSPLGGTVIEKFIREGQYVEKGDMLYRIADLDPIWLYLDIYEADLGWVQYGQTVRVDVTAYPREEFEGTVVFVDPFLNDATRTVKVRVNLPNANHRLKPAMYASATIRVRLRSDGSPEPTGLAGKFICPMHPEVVREELGKCPICEMDLERVPGDSASEQGPDEVAHSAPPGMVLAIPTTAVLDTGPRKVAYRQMENGDYELVDLKVGERATAAATEGPTKEYYPVLDGLREGDRVVIQGGFLIDSQRQISGMPSVLYAEGRSAASLHAGHGGDAAATPESAPTDSSHQH